MAALCRPNLVVVGFFSACCIGVLCITVKKQRGKAAAAILVFLSLFFLPIVAMVAHNYRLYRDFVPLSAVGGVNFYVGNNPEADGKFHLTKGFGTGLDEMIENSQKIAEETLKKKLHASQAANYWYGRGVQFILTEPAAAAKIFLTKIFYFFNRYEVPDILDIGFAAQFLPVLCMGHFIYGLMLVLGLWGMWLYVKKPVGGAGIYLSVFFFSYAFSVVLFFITARYRLGAVLGLVPFAALGADTLVKAAKKITPVGANNTVCLTVLAIVVFWPVETVNYAVNYNSLGIAMKNRGDDVSAERYYREALKIAPSYPSPYYNLGLLLRSQGKWQEAETCFVEYQNRKQAVMRS